MTYSSRSVEIIQVYLDLVMVLYSALLGGLFTLVIGIVYHWAKGTIASSWTTHSKLEVAWTAIPVVLLVWATVHSLIILYALESERYSASSVAEVEGLQWYWQYSLPSTLSPQTLESRNVNTADLPMGAPRLSLVDQPLCLAVDSTTSIRVTSSDVLHSWSVPALGIKIDAVPGRVSIGTVTPTTVGTYVGYCSELCGIGHAVMPINTVVY